jgi:SAM-dependent methyltransferase
MLGRNVMSTEPTDPRRSAGATQRNRVPILEVLRRVLPANALVLEVASGTGEHALFFAQSLPEIRWQPSDVDAAARDSIAAWCADTPNVQAPLALDVTEDVWPIDRADAVVCINMLHITPWRACGGLMRGASRVLGPGGVLYLYGPYRMGGAHTAPGNVAFDERLRGENQTWGVRDFEAVVACAEAEGLRFIEQVAMPANNFSLVFRQG